MTLSPEEREKRNEHRRCAEAIETFLRTADGKATDPSPEARIEAARALLAQANEKIDWLHEAVQAFGPYTDAVDQAIILRDLEEPEWSLLHDALSQEVSQRKQRGYHDAFDKVMPPTVPPPKALNSQKRRLLEDVSKLQRIAAGESLEAEAGEE